MWRALYSFVLYLLIPVAVIRLLWRARRAPDYRRRWGERFGFFPRLDIERSLWVHAVSVGEVQAALPLIKWLLSHTSALPVVVTTMTPTGSARVREALGDSVHHVYLPYDLPGAVRRFLAETRPQLALIMETELWPNLFHYCGRAEIPVIVANARLSARSAAGYRRFAALTRQTLAQVSMLAAQDAADAERFINLGVRKERLRITGNIKFDIQPPASLREQAAVLRREWGTDRPVWVAASTHEGEEEAVLDALAELRKAHPKTLLVVVPRHPERFERVAELCRRRGYAVARRSALDPCTSDRTVYLGDTMGELPLFYAASDVAFVGGSLVATGGHNVLEAAALELAVVVGPHTFNFAEITRMLVERGAVVQINDAAELAGVVARYLGDANLRHAAGLKGKQLVEENRGALARLEEIVVEILEKKGFGSREQ